jgi:hypothetical protein
MIFLDSRFTIPNFPSRLLSYMENKLPIIAATDINSDIGKVIEENDGYRLFYYKGEPIKKEEYLQIIYRLTWYSTTYDVNREVNNGRGPVDYAISKGSRDKTLVEFKLASNSKLKQNLSHQVEIYEKAHSTDSSIKVILYFNADEFTKVNKILKELKLDQDKNIILIDAGPKISASNVK